MRDVFFVVPAGIEDPARPSGGNTYDRQLLRELGAHGWSPHERAVAGFWDRPDGSSFAALEGTLGEIPDDSVVLIDGLIASPAAEVLLPASTRLQLVVLIHMPLGHRPSAEETRSRECAALTAAATIVTTSAWSRRRLLELYDLPADRVHVAEPGVERAEPSVGSEGGEELLCVGAVTSEKGHEILLEGLEMISSLPWRCACVGSLDREPEFVAGLRRRAREARLDQRVSFAGALTGADRDRAYGSADLLVHASRAETYGLVITEALAHGLPVIAADVGGVGEALGATAAGIRPGMLVPPEDPAALADALRAWLTDAELRASLRRAAAERRGSLPRWSATASRVADVLAEASR